MGRVLVFDTKEDAELALKKYHDQNERVTEELTQRIMQFYNINTQKPVNIRVSPDTTIGKGLEAICMVDLFVTGKEYSYDQSIHYYRSEGNYFKTLDKLTDDIKQSYQSISRMYTAYGADVSQMIYTIKEERSLLSDEDRQNIKKSLNDPELNKELEELPFFTRLFHRYLLKKLIKSLDCKETERGLTAEEIEKFEKLYF